MPDTLDLAARSTPTDADNGSSLAPAQLVPPEAPADLREGLPPAVVAWLDRWERDARSGDASPERLTELEALLGSSETNASAVAVVRLGDLLVAASSDGPSRDAALAVTDRLAVTAAERELTDLDPAHDLDAARPTLDAVRGLRGRVHKRPNWPMAERTFGLLARWEAGGAREAAWAKFLQAEALYEQGRIAEALAGFEESKRLYETSSMTPYDHVELAWARGLMLFSLDRYEEALPDLTEAADYSGYHHAADALAYLILARCRLGYEVGEDADYARLTRDFPDHDLITQVRLERAAAIRRAQAQRGRADGEGPTNG